MAGNNFVSSSMLGVDLQNASTTQLFALNTKILGTNDSEWHYVLATAILATGQFVQIFANGTAAIITTAMWGGAGADGTTGMLDIGCAQFTVSAGQYAWVAKRGNNMFLRCSGTVPPGNVAFEASGTLVSSLLAGDGLTALGCMIYASASTAGVSVTSGMLSYPRARLAQPVL